MGHDGHDGFGARKAKNSLKSIGKYMKIWETSTRISPPVAEEHCF